MKRLREQALKGENKRRKTDNSAECEKQNGSPREGGIFSEAEEAGKVTASESETGRVRTQSACGPSRRKQVQKINSRYWTHLKKKCNDWVVKTTPTEPSFCLIYWRSVRGHQEIIWEGPEHMRLFTEHPHTIDNFKCAALSKATAPKVLCASESQRGQNPEEELKRNPILLQSRNPAEYRNDVLSKIIPRILNPLGKRNFYEDISNRPTWFPKSVSFKRPNHPKSGEKRMSAEEMRTILQAFFVTCPECYEIVCDEAPNVKTHSNTTESPLPMALDKGNGPEMPLQEKMTSQQALQWCSDTTLWSELEMRVMKAAENVDLAFLSKSRILTIEEVSNAIDWRREQVLRNIVPESLIPCMSPAEGDCLFCAISLSLFGSYTHNTDLRFAALHYGIIHFDHYLQMLTTEIQSTEDALQFLATVVSTDEQFEHHPHGTPSEILEFTLKTEISSTSKIGSYSGILQILFLSGVTKYAITQHCEVQRDGYNTTLYPCGCNDTFLGTIHIMWVRSDPTSSTMNHIIPLLQRRIGGVDSQYSRQKLEKESTAHFIAKSLKYSVCRLCAHSGNNSEDMSMVQCDSCTQWYHCMCIGVCVDHFDNGEIFLCCNSPPPESNFEVVKSQSGRKRAPLKFSDVQSLYPMKGVSDAVVDFFVRILLPKPAVNMTTSALAYTAIVRSLKTNPSDLKRSFLNTNGPFDHTQPILLFPCSIRESWHWVLVAVYQEHEIAFVMDSMSPTTVQPYSNKAVENSTTLLRCWKPNIMLKAVAYQVPMQQGVDCGVHVMHHIKTISQSPLNALMEDPSVLKTPVDAEMLRKHILTQCCIHSRGSARRKRQKLMLRHTEAEMKKHELRDIEKMLLKQDTSGLKVDDIPEKGKGVVTTRMYKKGQFVCEYDGDVIPYQEAREREVIYLKDSDVYKGYMYYFTFKNRKYCIDATEDRGQLGRMINHSRKIPNIIPKLFDISGKPHVCFFTMRDIAEGEELLYDYGDTSATAVKAHPWLLE